MENSKNEIMLDLYLPVKNHPSFWETHYHVDHEKGGVKVNYGSKIGLRYNSTTTAQYALSNYNEYLNTGNDQFKKEFFSQVCYLSQQYTDVNLIASGYCYEFPYEPYKLEPGWYSALSQGQVLSVFARYLSMQSDEMISVLMVKIKNLLMLPIESGGLLRLTPEGYIWLEEYPSTPPSLVLNGFVSAVHGLHDFLALFPDDKPTKNLYDNCLRSVKESFTFYDVGFWLKYSRYKMMELAPVNYLPYQKRQMEYLYKVTKDQAFKNYAHKIDSYYNNRLVRFLLIHKKVIKKGINILALSVIIWVYLHKKRSRHKVI